MVSFLSNRYLDAKQNEGGDLLAAPREGMRVIAWLHCRQLCMSTFLKWAGIQWVCLFFFMVAVLKSEPRAWHMLEVFFTTKLYCPPNFTLLSQALTKLPGLVFKLGFPASISQAAGIASLYRRMGLVFS